MAERQEDLDETITGPPVSAAFTPTGSRRRRRWDSRRSRASRSRSLGVVETPKGEYLVANKHHRGKSTVDALPELLGGLLRDLAFPKQMHWDAMLEDGRGELCSAGRSAGCCICTAAASCRSRSARTPNAAGPLVQDVDVRRR